MGKPVGELPLPPFYDPALARRWDYRPDPLALFQQTGAWRRAHDVAPSGSDAFRLHLLLIDVQKDFCFPEGTLYVGGRSGTGAMDDSQRIAAFIYRNARWITRITTTLDTHFVYQIFFPWFFVDEEGRPLAPHTLIRLDGDALVNTDPAGQVLRRPVRPNPAVAEWLCDGDYPWLCKQVAFYCAELARSGKYTLYLWPPHCLLGSEGHGLVGVVHEARLFHAFLRGAQSWAEAKGDHPLTENYSVLRPEVLMGWDGRPLVEKNVRFLNALLKEDGVVVAGQAASHCVKSTIEDLLDEVLAQDPALARKVYILTDCMSSVVVPDGRGGIAADFTPEAEAAQQRFAEAGMRLVRSTDPIESWPGIKR